MQCVMCGNEMDVRTETRRHDVGLDEAVTIEQVEVSHCSRCGEEYVGIHRAEGLHEYIAVRLARKIERLTPREIRFLRAHLGHASSEFAGAVGVRPETVSRWERVDRPMPMPPPTERLLRLMVLNAAGHTRVSLEALGSAEAAPIHLRLVFRDNRWTAEDDPSGSAVTPSPGATRNPASPSAA